MSIEAFEQREQMLQFRAKVLQAEQERMDGAETLSVSQAGKRLKETHIIRLTGILIVRDEILLIEQNVRDRKWYLPGGRLETDETIEEGIKREMLEETGAEVEVERMICIADTDFEAPSMLHILLKVNLCGGVIGVQDNKHDTVPITDVKFVSIDALTGYGFSERFMQECKCGFKNVPLYVGKDTFLDFDVISR